MFEQVDTVGSTWWSCTVSGTMSNVRYRAETVGSEQLADAETRVLDGRTLTIVRSRSALVECVHSRSGPLVVDLAAFDISEHWLLSWTLQMTQGRRVAVLADDPDPDLDLPVSPVAVDATVSRPISEARLREMLSEFDHRDRYADLLDAYQACVAALVDADTDHDRERLEDRRQRLEAELAAFEDSADDRDYTRTMREVLQRTDQQ